MSDLYTDEETEAAASVLLDDYATEYSAGHLSWRDFETPAQRILDAVAPAIIRRAKAEALRLEADRFESEAATAATFERGMLLAVASRLKARAIHIEGAK